MNIQCGARNYNGHNHYKCDEEHNHIGSHYDSRYYKQWPRVVQSVGTGGAIETAAGVLQFTTHELAELYVILSGNHGIPELYLNKIGAALKEML